MLWLGIPLIALGLAWTAFFLVKHVRASAQARAAADWPSVEGIVVESRTDDKVTTDSDGYDVHVFTPVVRYSYAVGDRSFEGQRIRFGEVRTGSRAKAESWRAPFRTGERTRLRYNPADPADSVLTAAAPTGSHVVAALVGFVFVALGFYALAS